MRPLRRSLLLVVGLALAACGSDASGPADDASTTSSTTAPSTTTDAADTESESGSGDGLGESVGVTDEVVITVLDEG